MSDNVFLRPEEEQNFLQRLGAGLQRVGAGFSGNLQQFDANQMAMDRQLSYERQKAAAQDLQTAKAFIDRGDISSFLKLAENRAADIRELGGDPSDTLQLAQLGSAALNGDQSAYNALKNELDVGIIAASNAGFIDAPKAATPLSPEGKREADRRAGLLPEKVVAPSPKTKAVFDTQTGQQAFASDQQIAENPNRFLPENPERKADFAPSDIVKIEDSLIKSAMADKRIGNFLETKISYNRIQSATPTAAGDLSLIFNFMKMLDPASVVREGEFATAQNAAGVDSRIANIYNNVLEGTRLSEKQRADFMSNSVALLEKAEKSAQRAIKPYRKRATNAGADYRIIYDSVFGLDPEDIERVIGGQGSTDLTGISDEDLLADIMGE